MVRFFKFVWENFLGNFVYIRCCDKYFRFFLDWKYVFRNEDFTFSIF